MTPKSEQNTIDTIARVSRYQGVVGPWFVVADGRLELIDPIYLDVRHPVLCPLAHDDPSPDGVMQVTWQDETGHEAGIIQRLAPGDCTRIGPFDARAIDIHCSGPVEYRVAGLPPPW